MRDQLTGYMQGLVTAAQKLNRKGILNKYKEQVDEAYSSSS
jgi:long-chain acyl-CoA synthetase